MFRSSTSELRSRKQDGIFSASPIASRKGESRSKYVYAPWYLLNPDAPPAKIQARLRGLGTGIVRDRGWRSVLRRVSIAAPEYRMLVFVLLVAHRGHCRVTV